MLTVENGTVYTPEEVIPDGAVLIEDGTIEAVGYRKELNVPAGVKRLDANGGDIAPGFVNIHVHGVKGYTSMAGDPVSLRAMSRLFLPHGVTSWVPTTGSAPLSDIIAACSGIREAMEENASGAEILGGHVEGPYLSPQERGAHPLELLVEPRPEEYRELLEYADAIRVFTVAPELPGALDLIGELKERGILVSAGHSVAIDREFERAVATGLSHATHMFCNMGTLRRDNLRRVAGLVESILLDDRVTTEIIADGYHIAPSLMQLALKVKGPERVAIVTDGSSLTGLPPGTYTRQGTEIILEEEISYVADRSAYAGSVASMDQCLRVALDSMDLSLSDAFRMASLTPAAIVGVSDRKGRLRAGKDADVVILDDALDVTYTVARGVVFDAQSGTDDLPDPVVEEDGALF